MTALDFADTDVIAITPLGRLALLAGQVNHGLDDEAADRQYLLEQVSTELARILDADQAPVRLGAPPASEPGEVPR